MSHVKHLEQHRTQSADDMMSHKNKNMGKKTRFGATALVQSVLCLMKM